MDFICIKIDTNYMIHYKKELQYIGWILLFTIPFPILCSHFYIIKLRLHINVNTIMGTPLTNTIFFYIKSIASFITFAISSLIVKSA